MDELVVSVRLLRLRPEANDLHGRFALFVLLSVTAIGAFLRFHRLDALGLTGDEGLQLLAVRGILEEGLPRMPSGAMAARSPWFQQVQAALAGVLGAGVLSLRLPSALLGTLAIPATYWLGATVWSRRVGLLAASAIALSTWGIELSRYGRFYTALQLFWIVSLVLFYQAWALGRRRAWLLLAPAALLLFSSHQLARLFLTIPLALAFVPGRSWRERGQAGAATGGLLALWWLQERARRMIGDQGDFLPELPLGVPEWGWVGDLREFLGLPSLNMPDFRGLAALLESAPVAVVILAALTIGATVVLLRWGIRSDQAHRLLPLVPALVALCCHQVVVALLLLLADAAWSWKGARDALRWPSGHLLVATSVAVIAWFAVLAFAGTDPETAVLALFGFPNLTQYIGYWLVIGWPAFLVVLLVGVLLVLEHWLDDRSRTGGVFLLLSFGVPAVAAACVRSYPESRYFFHLQPVMTLIWSIAVIELGRGLAARVWGVSQRCARMTPWIVAVLALVLCGDADPAKAWRVTVRDYGDEKDCIRSVISWRLHAGWHPDYSTVTDWVIQHATEADRVIVLGPAHVLATHRALLGRVDFFVARDEDRRYLRRRPDGVIIDSMTAVPALLSAGEVRSALEPSPTGRCFLIGDHSTLAPDSPFYDPELRTLLLERVGDPDLVARDGYTFVRVLP